MRRNQAFFVSKEFQKAIYTRCRLKNKTDKSPTTKNITAYKRQRNLYVLLRRKTKPFLSNVTKGALLQITTF